jgi:uridine kinase
LIVFPSAVLFCIYADADVRLARRIRRDTTERGRDVTSVLEQVFKHGVFSVTISLIYAI